MDVVRGSKKTKAPSKKAEDAQPYRKLYRARASPNVRIRRTRKAKPRRHKLATRADISLAGVRM